jgi:hypothetical protein
MRSAARFKAVLIAAALACGALAASDGLPFRQEQLNHWAYQKVQKPKVPVVRNRALAATPVDAFVLEKLEAKRIKPSPKADRATLLRRATFDLAGLPPTPEETRDFLADESPKAFEKVVDRLLAIPRYSEKWARHWLDLARYADSEGFKADETRPNAWRYRDYASNPSTKTIPTIGSSGSRSRATSSGRKILMPWSPPVSTGTILTNTTRETCGSGGRRF